MKLELKYWSAYLPYKLKIFDLRTSDIEILESVSIDGLKTEFDEYFFNQAKPILRPMSDLHKYNEKGDKSFRDELLLNSELQNDFERDFITEYIDNLHFDKILLAPYSIIQKLLELHFDIFGLIENNLAVDKNKI